MAEVPSVYINCAVYVYPSEFSKAGGSAFIVQLAESVGTSDNLYVVTAAHNIEDRTVGVGPVIRINKDGGGSEPIQTNHDAWFCEPSDDLAITPLGLPLVGLNYTVIPTNGFITKELIQEHRLGPGNDVFITGRFAPQEGEKQNTPTVRFGNISLMPFEPFKRPGKETLDEVFLVEFRSIGGYSGSPVFLCEIPFHLRFRGTNHQIWSHSPHLLGVDVGHVSDWKLVKKWGTKKYEDDKPEKWYESNTAMSVIVPAWKLLALLDREDVVSIRKDVKTKDPGDFFVEDSLTHRETATFTQQDFEADLRKVARRVKPSESGKGKK